MKINETIRKDGLRMISCYVPHKKSVLVELVARVGHAYDPSDKPGLFHVFEHMASKGTKKRTANELSSFASRNFISDNACTSTLETAYEVLAIDRKLPLACEYLCDIYFNSLLPSAELKKEKKVILMEIARKKDSDGSVANRAADKCLYKRNPLRNMGIGTATGLARIHRADLVEQKNKWHIPSNTVAIAVGNVKHRDFVEEISKRIPLSAKKVSLTQWTDEASDLPSKREVTIKLPNREKSILLLNCKIPRDLDMKKQEAFSLFSKLIGSGDSDSILWREIREKRGLAYVIRSSYSSTTGLGDEFYVYAEIHPSKSAQVEKLIWQVLAKPLSDKRRFDELREGIAECFEIDSFENSSFESYEDLIRDKIILGKPVKEVEGEDKKRLKVISNLSLKDLEAVRKEFIRPERFVRVLVEPE
jgi:predicted Zn-dependent peptidase